MGEAANGNKRSNIVLIGMPGSGKSTVGVILAKLTSRDFVDTDVLIQKAEERSLQEIIDAEGYMALRKIEEVTLLGLAIKNGVIATGGSAVYSYRAMTHLKESGHIIFLDVDQTTLESRIRDFSTRGLAKSPDQVFGDLFRERFILYTMYADITVKYAGQSHEEVCKIIIDRLGKILADA